MKRLPVLLALASMLAVGFVTGALFAMNRQNASPASDSVPVPAYLVGAAQITDFERLPEYRKVAEPLARQGGYTVIAAADTAGDKAVLLEGEWPAEGLLFIERYDSMDKLLAFVNSDAFKEAKLLRDQVAEVFFMFALPGGESGTSGH